MKTYDVQVREDGNIQWRFEGKLHREDGPAINALMELKNGFSMVSDTVKMALLLKALMAIKHGFSMVSYTV